MKRTKRRYLAISIDSEVLPSEREFMDAVWGSVTRLYGEVGASQAGLSLIDFDVERGVAVVKVSLASLNMVRACLAAVTCASGRETVLRVLSVSGTLKALFSNVR